jgi:RHH-type transcriptional regulator, proline utilization regulon repressor / proline dehydrogenase / delta 1-pyrroline-5-carboxylate dehydrogenase
VTKSFNSSLDRSAFRKAYRVNEESCLAERIPQARLTPVQLAQAEATAIALVEAVRAKPGKGGIDAFMQTFELSSQEGVALMCLAEALLRIPDPATRDALIADKIGGANWSKHFGASPSAFVNASIFALMLTGRVLTPSKANADWISVIGRAVTRLGEPVIRQAVVQGMRVLGHQFVFGRTVEEALERGKTDLVRGDTHSFDMLGEAAKTQADADRYFASYSDSIAAVAKLSKGLTIEAMPGISVKLSALHPRYEFAHAERVVAEMLPRLRQLAKAASDAGIGFTIDAEEADRLELSMDLIEALVADDTLFAGGWTGLGLALQAYQKRAVPLVDWTIKLARRHRRKLMVRLVKGAYWDSEIKATQVGGFTDYPVFTRKASTDVSYLACAKRLLAAPDAIYAAFATHNAVTIGAVKALAECTPFEFQRLHGMGEELYQALREAEATPTRVRIYAPVGGHKELLAYLVRRLLENGANSSFVNRIADADLPIKALIADPVSEIEALPEKRNSSIPLPRDLFGAVRVNSTGIDLSDPQVREPLLERLAVLDTQRPVGSPLVEREAIERQSEPVRAPFDHGLVVGSVVDATPSELMRAMDLAHNAQPAWDSGGVESRASCLLRAADLFEADTDNLLSLCQREAGKTLPDAIAELREAVDFLRYYADLGRRQFASPEPLPGPTGEANSLSLHGRGVFAAISPWNFPLAIFTGQVAAALVAGNTVVAKPAEQTPLIAYRAVELLHKAGVPADVLHLLPGDGAVIGAALVKHARVAGVVFTGSNATAKAINAALAAKHGAIVPLIAETGGQNAMIVDSSALPEQVTRDVLASAFQSAGQRCSALRVLFVQDDVADAMLAMIAGAMRTLTIGDPRRLDTDVGPVIDADAKASLDAHVAELDRTAKRVCRLDLPEVAARGTFIAPAAYEIASLSQLDREHFGPLLHVVRFKAAEFDAVIDAINATGFGLTLGVHSRIDATVERIRARARVGNLYVNRNQIGAVVGSQPFGGEGLSGTGPKAGGPHYLLRFANERTACIDTTAAGGNASLLAT